MKQHAFDYVRAHRTRELEQFLAGFRFDIARQLFQEDLERSGLDPSDINFIWPELFSASENEATGFSIPTSIINLNFRELIVTCHRSNIPKEVGVTHVVFHEETHAVGQLVCIYKDEKFPLKVRQAGHNIPGGAENFDLFSEGVVNTLAFEKLCLYADRLNWEGKYGAKRFSQIMDLLDRQFERPREQTILRWFISALSLRAQISEKVVWEAIKAGHYTGENLKNGELRDFLNETIAAHFMESVGRGDLPELNRSGLGDIADRILNSRRKN